MYSSKDATVEANTDIPTLLLPECWWMSLPKVSPPWWARVHYFSWGQGGHPLTLHLLGESASPKVRKAQRRAHCRTPCHPHSYGGLCKCPRGSFDNVCPSSTGENQFIASCPKSKSCEFCCSISRWALPTKTMLSSWVMCAVQCERPPPLFSTSVTVKAAEDALHTLMGPPCIPTHFLLFSPKMAFVTVFHGERFWRDEVGKVGHVCILNAKARLWDVTTWQSFHPQQGQLSGDAKVSYILNMVTFKDQLVQ